MTVKGLFDVLTGRFGSQGWWPAETPFETIVGAVLTQNTAWTNVERAVANLRQRDALKPGTLLSLPQGELQALIRPSGYFRQKALRLRTISIWLKERGGVDGLSCVETPQLREELLSLTGIGPETADSILCYALERPVFVVDAYTRRVFGRHGEGGDYSGRVQLDAPFGEYEEVRAYVEANIEPQKYGELHALLVRLAKEHCTKREPLCDTCPVEAAVRSQPTLHRPV